jgi:hypothetical protein
VARLANESGSRDEDFERDRRGNPEVTRSHQHGVSYTIPRPKGDYRWVPETSGIFRLYQGDRIVYVGQTNNLRARLQKLEREMLYWGAYDYKSTVGINTRERKRMGQRSITYNDPTRNIRRE